MPAGRMISHGSVISSDCTNNARGGVGSLISPVYPRELVKRAIELDASAILIAHNHPSGDPTPSHADIEMTKAIIVACQTLGIAVHDHVIVGKHGHASFKALGLM